MEMELKLYNGIQQVVIINFGGFKKDIKIYTGLVHGMIQIYKLVIMKNVYIFIKGKSICGKLLGILMIFELFYYSFNF
jgi:hypothetical protein